LNLRVSTVVFGINVVVGVALFYVVGPIGVVVATVVSAAIGYTSRAYFVRSLLPTVTLLPRPFIHQTVSGLLMGVIVFGVRALWPVYGLLSILAVIWLGAAIYFISLITISAPFRETVRGVARDAGVQRFV
jgi:hypothetical protein